MNGYGTMTQKGQVAIPIAIRRHFNLKASSKLFFGISGNKIVAEPIMTSEQAMGFIRTRKRVSKAQWKKSIREAVVRKYLNKRKHGRA